MSHSPLTALAARGVTHESRTDTSESTLTIAGLPIPISRETTVRHTLRLPGPSGIRLSAGPIRWHHRLLGFLFGPIRTGDPTFDERVFLTSATPDATRAWLASAAHRSLLGDLVDAGATVRWDDTTVRAAVPLLAFDDEGASRLALLVEAALPPATPAP